MYDFEKGQFARRNHVLDGEGIINYRAKLQNILSVAICRIDKNTRKTLAVKHEVFNLMPYYDFCIEGNFVRPIPDEDGVDTISLKSCDVPADMYSEYMVELILTVLSVSALLKIITAIETNPTLESVLSLPGWEKDISVVTFEPMDDFKEYTHEVRGFMQLLDIGVCGIEKALLDVTVTIFSCGEHIVGMNDEFMSILPLA